MWAEVIVSAEDLDGLLRQAVPFSISFGHPDEIHSLALSDVAETRLVAGLGLRVVCKARISWPILGIKVPLSLNSVTLLLLPTIGRGPHGDVLTFRLSIEHADFSGIPTLIDTRITEAINAKLAEKEIELSWDFTRGMTLVARLPALLEPLDSFALRPAWGKVRITEEAVVYAVSFHMAVVRRGGESPAWLAAVEPSAAPAEPASGA
jgi:hypothetical protein